MTPRRPLSHLWEDFFAASLFHRSRRDNALIDELRDDIVKLSHRPVVAADLWNEKRARLRQLVLARDPFDFLRWDVIRTTMVKRGREPVTHELRHLQRRPNWKLRWRPALRESTIGRPRPFYLYPRSSGTLIHQAYHLCRFEEATGLPLTTVPFVVEFGGGYGSMCRLLHQLGFAGTYVIFDLPEVSALQRFFLRHLDIPVFKGENQDRASLRGVFTTSDLGNLKFLLRSRPTGQAAFIATWSLTEAPVELGTMILSEVVSFDAFLFGYKERFEAIDNVRFFSEWRSTLSDHTWHEFPIPHLRKAERYLFGVKGDRSDTPCGKATHGEPAVPPSTSQR